MSTAGSPGTLIPPTDDARPPATLDEPSAAADRQLPLGLLVLCLAAHVPLGLAMHSNRTIATAHAAATVVTVVWVLASARSAGPLLRVAGYVVGAEVLWRQTRAVVPWELGKYLLIVIFTVGIIRFIGRPSNAGVPIVFLAVLLPACAAPFVILGPMAGIEPVSFNVGGLIALGVGAIFISHLAGPWSSMRPVLWSLVAPVVATATLGTEAARHLVARDFFSDSNFKAAGGFGPNQVSAILGLGALCLVMLAIRERGFTRPLIAVLLTMWFLVQGGLTFSRGGMTNFAIAVVVALPLLLRRRKTAVRVLVVILAVGVVGALVVFPRLDRFTGGELQARYSNQHEADLRSELVRKEYQTFLNHIVLGVGAGQSETIEINRRIYSSHTEYTRLLAEHGLLGLVAIASMVAMVVYGYRRQKLPWGHAWTLAFAAWALADMSHAATRIAAPSFAFAIALFTFVTEADAEQPTGLR